MYGKYRRKSYAAKRKWHKLFIVHCLGQAEAADEAFSETRRHARLLEPFMGRGRNLLPNYCENFQKPHNRQQRQHTRTHTHTQTHTRVQIHSNTQLADTFHENVRIRFGRCRRCRCRLVSITRLTADINCPMSPNGNCVNCLTIFQQIY